MNSTYLLLKVISDAAFFFLPMLLAYTSSQKFGANPLVLIGLIAFFTFISPVFFSIPTDISKMNDVPSIMNHIEPDSPEGYLIGRKNVLGNPELVKPTIVINYVNEERVLPPTLIIHGNKDRLSIFTKSLVYLQVKIKTGRFKSSCIGWFNFEKKLLRLLKVFI